MNFSKSIIPHGRGAFTGFNPETDITSQTMVWRFDAHPDYLLDSAGDPVDTDQEEIKTWTNLITAEDDIEQTTQIYRPLYEEDAGSGFLNAPAVYMDDQGGFAGTAGMPDMTGGGEIFFVQQLANDPPTGTTQSGHSRLGTTTNTHYTWSDNNAYMDFGTNARKSTGNPSADLSNAHILNMYSVANEWEMFINNVSHYYTTTNTMGFHTTPYIGTSGSFTAYRMEGWISHVWLWAGGKLSDADRDTVHDHLATFIA